MSSIRLGNKFARQRLAGRFVYVVTPAKARGLWCERTGDGTWLPVVAEHMSNIAAIWCEEQFEHHSAPAAYLEIEGAERVLRVARHSPEVLRDVDPTQPAAQTPTP